MDEINFPWSATLMLSAIAGAAGWAWWQAWRHQGGAWRQLRASWAPPSRDVEGDAIELATSLRLDAATRLHCVRWRGQVLLIASHATAPAVVLARSSDRANDGVAP